MANTEMQDLRKQLSESEARVHGLEAQIAAGQSATQHRIDQDLPEEELELPIITRANRLPIEQHLATFCRSWANRVFTPQSPQYSQLLSIASKMSTNLYSGVDLDPNGYLTKGGMRKRQDALLAVAIVQEFKTHMWKQRRKLAACGNEGDNFPFSGALWCWEGQDLDVDRVRLERVLSSWEVKHRTVSAEIDVAMSRIADELPDQAASEAWGVLEE